MRTAMNSSHRHYILGIALAACAALPAHADEVPIDIAALKGTVLSDTNAYRGSKKLPELKQNAALEAAGRPPANSPSTTPRPARG